MIAPRLALFTALVAALVSPAACSSSATDSPSAPSNAASAADAGTVVADAATGDATAADAGQDAAPAPRTRVRFVGIGPIGVFDASLASANGECSTSRRSTRILLSELDVSATDAFRLFATDVAIP